jgi:hypothetical protein
MVVAVRFAACRADICLTLLVFPERAEAEASFNTRETSGQMPGVSLEWKRLRNLPAGLYNARDLALEREAAEAQTADAELAEERAWTTAKLAAVVLAGFELRLACVFDALCGSSHNFLLSLSYCN